MQRLREHRAHVPAAREVLVVSCDPVVVPDAVADAIPDPGEYFLDWCGLGRLPPAIEARLTQEVDALRGPDGFIPWRNANRVKLYAPKLGPLTYLSAMTVFDPPAIGVWATSGSGLKRREKREFEAAAASVLEAQGHAPAAAWVIAHNSHVLPLDYVADQLRGSWSEQLNRVSNGQFAKSLKH